MTKRVLAVLLFGAVFGIGSLAAQTAWTQITIRLRDNCVPDAQASWTLCRLAYIHQTTAAPNGGPQALEGHTVVDHDRGFVQLALGTIGNLEASGAAGTVTEQARAMQSGIIVTDAGRIWHASGLFINAPQRHSTYQGPVNVDRYDFLTLCSPDGCWSLRPRGRELVVCDQLDRCRPL